MARKVDRERWKATGLCANCGSRPRGRTLDCEQCAETDQIYQYRYMRTPEGRYKVAVRRARHAKHAPPKHEQFLDAWATRLAREWEGAMCCDVCGTKEPGTGRDWCLDHDHKTGTVRGWLCWPCNLAEGKLRTSENARKLADYMAKWE